MKGMGNINDMVKKAQKLQEEFSKMQDALKEKTVEASAGGGVVTVVANGAKQILEIKINRELVNPDDVDMLQDLVVAAVNEALVKTQEMIDDESKKLTGGLGLNMPGMF